MVHLDYQNHMIEIFPIMKMALHILPSSLLKFYLLLNFYLKHPKNRYQEKMRQLRTLFSREIIDNPLRFYFLELSLMRDNDNDQFPLLPVHDLEELHKTLKIQEHL